jgi:DNA-binding MarR family transcriptional regulator
MLEVFNLLPSELRAGRVLGVATSSSDATAAAEAWALMFELFQETKAERMAAIAEFGLAPMQAMLLGQLVHDEPQPMSALATALRCDNSSVTHTVDRLEALGLVERRPAPHDRRVKTVALTEQGMGVQAEVRRAMAQPPEQIAGLAEADQRVLRDVLTRALGR